MDVGAAAGGYSGFRRFGSYEEPHEAVIYVDIGPIDGDRLEGLLPG